MKSKKTLEEIKQDNKKAATKKPTDGEEDDVDTQDDNPQDGTQVVPTVHGREQFSKNPNYKADKEKPEEKASPIKKKKEPEPETDFDKSMTTMKTKCCTDRVMQICNLLGCIVLFLSVIMRFAYLFPVFNGFFMIETFYLGSFIIIMSMSEGMFGPSYSKRVRTNFNFLDCNMGRGAFLIFQALILMERTKRGEDVFGFIVILLGLFNIFLGYNNKIKELPIIPWGDQLKKESEIEAKKRRNESLKDLNIKKKQIEKEKDLDKKIKQEHRKDKDKEKYMDEAAAEEISEVSSSIESVDVDLIKDKP